MAWQHGLESYFFPSRPWLAWLMRRRQPLYQRDQAVRLRCALETLGPLFIKFGQMLSTRHDFLDAHTTAQLATLQDHVTPMPFCQIKQHIENAYGKRLEDVFASFEEKCAASASIAQVYFASLRTGEAVAIKVIRPQSQKKIQQDIRLMQIVAWLIEKTIAQGPQMKPRALVAEFKRTTYGELDLLTEAAHCSALRHHFHNHAAMIIPRVHWPYCTTTVLVIDRVYGTPISHVQTLMQQGIDLKKVAEAGVAIFFTQVLRDGFFHADMHPGNVFVLATGQYAMVDFGIMGILTEVDKNYLAINFLGFFDRNYRQIAQAHLDAGWISPHACLDHFETTIRVICEPIFDKPLHEISFGRLFIRLFQASLQFGMTVQPQLMLLQKTLLNIESLGRMLYPELDLWTTAKPCIKKWLSRQMGWRAFLRNTRQEWPYWMRHMPSLPRLIHSQLVHQSSSHPSDQKYRALARRYKRLTTLCFFLSVGALLTTMEWLHPLLASG